MAETLDKTGSGSGNQIRYEHSDVNARRVAAAGVAGLALTAVLVLSVWAVLSLLWDRGEPPRLPLAVTLPAQGQPGHDASQSGSPQ